VKKGHGIYDCGATRARLLERELVAEISATGMPAPLERHEALGRRAHQLLAQRQQEARVVHGATWERHRPLSAPFGGGHRSAQAP
jgi:hypothetical protein